MKFQIARDSDMQVEIDVEALARVLSPVARWATVTGKLITGTRLDQFKIFIQGELGPDEIKWVAELADPGDTS